MELNVTECLACNSSNIRKYTTTKAMMHSSKQKFNFDQCDNCKLVFLNPRVSIAELGDYYTDYYLPYRGPAAWGKYAPFVERDQKNIDTKRVKTVNKYATLDRESVVLDIGCGKPSFLHLLHAKHESIAIGTDFSDHGWANNPEVYKRLDLQVGQPLDVVVPQKVDAITMWHYLEHDYHPKTTLRGLLPLTHTKTKLIIEVPDHDADSRKKFQSSWAGYHTPRHTGLYTMTSMEALLENSGWSVVDSYSSGTLDPYTLVWMSEMEKKGIDWSENMESRFTNYVQGMVRYFPKRLFSRGKHNGFITFIASPKD